MKTFFGIVQPRMEVKMGFVKIRPGILLVLPTSLVLLAAFPSRSLAAAPKPLTTGGDLDPILQKNCSTPGAIKKEVLDKATADASGWPAGEIGTFDCKLRKSGAATWVMHMGDDENTGNIYQITVYGPPGKQLLKIGVLFAKPVLSAAGQKALDAAISGYTKKPTDDGTAQWEIEGVTFTLLPVLGGKFAGQWSFGIARAGR